MTGALQPFVLPVSRDADTAAFFDGTARGEFLALQCEAGHVSSPRSQRCESCGSEDLTSRALRGGAVLRSWTTVPLEHGPVVLAIGEFDEGPWWWGPLHVADGDVLRVGMPLRLSFPAPVEGETIPVFVVAP